jgi:hypothetical protein
MKRYLFILPVILLILYTSSIHAQVPHSPENTPEIISKAKSDMLLRCRSCRLTLTNKDIINGKMVDLGPDSIRIEAVRIYSQSRDPFQSKDWEHRTASYSFTNINSIECGDSAINGIAWGAAVGIIIPGFILSAIASSDGPQYEISDRAEKTILLSMLGGGVIGGTIGYLLDIAIGGRQKEMDFKTVRRIGEAGDLWDKD